MTTPETRESTDPRTEAGRRLAEAWWQIDEEAVVSHILAIEADARTDLLVEVAGLQAVEVVAEIKRLRAVEMAAAAFVDQTELDDAAVANLRASLSATTDPSGHPEAKCWRCHGPNVVWSAPSPLWNEVMRRTDREPFSGIVCPTCFAILAEEADIGAGLWRLYPERIGVALPTVFGDGRVWNAETWLWEEPQDPATDGG